LISSRSAIIPFCAHSCLPNPNLGRQGDDRRLPAAGRRKTRAERGIRKPTPLLAGAPPKSPTPGGIPALSAAPTRHILFRTDQRGRRAYAAPFLWQIEAGMPCERACVFAAVRVAPIRRTRPRQFIDRTGARRTAHRRGRDHARGRDLAPAGWHPSHIGMKPAVCAERTRRIRMVTARPLEMRAHDSRRRAASSATALVRAEVEAH
jgi:hypothetical protein